MIQPHEAQLIIHLHDTSLLETLKRPERTESTGGNGLTMMHRVWRGMGRRGDALRQFSNDVRTRPESVGALTKAVIER